MAESRERPAFLMSDEFVIIRDESCHLIHGSGQQIALTPATLYLTNRKVYVEPQVPNVPPASLALEQIETTEETETNDCLCLWINKSLTIFVPEHEHQVSFGELVMKLSAAAKREQIECDSMSLSLQRRFIEAKTLSRFYAQYKANKDNLVDEPPIEAEMDTLEMLQQINAAPVRVVDVLTDFIGLGEFVPFALFITFIGVLAIVFVYVPLGVFVCGLAFLAIMKHGFSLIFSKTPRKDEFYKFAPRISRDFKAYIQSYEIFTNAFRKRFMWRNPRQTLETAMFLVSTAAMFAFCDPAFVLLIALIGLSYVERWNPFGFGSISEILTALFQFNS